MTYIASVGIITASISAFMGLLVYLVEKKSTINTLVQVSFLSLFALGVTVFFAGDKSYSLESITNLWRFGYLGILFTPPIVVHIIHLILGIYAPAPRNLLVILYGVSTFFGIALFSGFVLHDISFTTWGYYDPNADLLGYMFIVFLFLALGYGGTLCIKYYADISETQKSQIFGLFLALVFGGLGALFFYLPDFGITQYQWGTIFLAGYPGFMGYAILRYQFFDISNAFLKVLRLIGSIVVGGVLFLLIIWFIFGGNMFRELISEKNILFYLFGGVFWFLLYKSRFAHDLTNPKEKQKLINIVNTFLSDTHPYDTVESLQKTLQKYFAEFVSSEQQIHIYDRVELHRYPGLLGHFTHHTTPITRESEIYKNYADTLDVEVIFPLYSEKEHVIGLLLMGEKAESKQYSQEDIDIISRILLKLSLSLQVLSHNLDLRLEVIKRTQELTKKNEELAVAYEDLKKVDKQKDAFLAIASHELRTPMTIIKGYSDMLLKGAFGNLTESQAKYMMQIFENTETLIKFVNNILDISKLEAGRMPFTYTVFSHKKSIRTVVDNFMTLYAQKSIALSLTDTTLHDTINSDESKLVLIMNNLLSNAYKFTGNNGSVSVLVRDVQKEGKDYLEISVQDTGIGMDEETMKHIFEKYNQSDNQEYTRKSIEGSGLGLHLTRQVLRYMKGDISVSSQVGHGTTLLVHIPYTQNS